MERQRESVAVFEASAELAGDFDTLDCRYDSCESCCKHPSNLVRKEMGHRKEAQQVLTTTEDPTVKQLVCFSQGKRSSKMPNA